MEIAIKLGQIDIIKLKTTQRSGFTLAEILLTLTVIGVVAAMTIPAIISNTNKQENITAWKKTFAVYSAAVKQMATDNGGSVKDIIGASATSSCNPTNGTHCVGLRDKFCNYLSCIKKCDSYDLTNENNNCYSSFQFSGNSTNHNLPIPLAGGKNGTPWHSWNDGSSAVLNNGTTVYFMQAKNDCSLWGTTYDCVDLVVDVNGKKGPNFVGKDVFPFSVYEDSKGVRVSAGDTNNDGNSCYFETGKNETYEDGNFCGKYYLLH